MSRLSSVKTKPAVEADQAHAEYMRKPDSDNLVAWVEEEVRAARVRGVSVNGQDYDLFRNFGDRLRYNRLGI